MKKGKRSDLMANKIHKKIPKASKRLIGLSVLLLIAYGLFVAAIHWIYAYHQERPPDPVGKADVPVGQAQVMEHLSLEPERTHPRYLPVLMYHHIDEEPERFQSGTLTPERFEEDMLYLTALGFETINTRDLKRIIEGKQDWPERPIMVTIDDGYRSVYEHAYPILKSVNQKAISTVIGSSVGRHTHLFSGAPIIPHFSWKEAREMSASGVIDIQSHSFDLHQPGGENGEGKGAGKKEGETNAAYIKRFTADTLNNHHFIEENIPGHQVALYSYPYGIYNEMTENALKELGYIATLTVEPGINEIEQGFFALKRINMAEFVSGYTAFEHILRLMDWDEPVPYTDKLSRRERIDALRKTLGLSDLRSPSVP